NLTGASLTRQIQRQLSRHGRNADLRKDGAKARLKDLPTGILGDLRLLRLFAPLDEHEIQVRKFASLTPPIVMGRGELFHNRPPFHVTPGTPQPTAKDGVLWILLSVQQLNISKDVEGVPTVEPTIFPSVTPQFVEIKDSLFRVPGDEFAHQCSLPIGLIGD